MADPRLNVLLTARDEASPKVVALFDQFGRMAAQVEQTTLPATTRSTQAITAMEAATVKAARAARALALPLATELAPAFGAVTAQSVQAIGAAAFLASGWTAAGIAAASLAGIVGGQLVRSFQEAAKARAEFQAALGSPLPGDVSRQIDATAARIRQLAADRDALVRDLPARSGDTGVGAEFGAGAGSEEEERQAAAIQKRIGALNEEIRLLQQKLGALQDITLSEAEAERFGEALLESRRQREQLVAQAAAQRATTEQAMAQAAIAAERQLLQAQGQRTLSAAEFRERELALVTRARDAELEGIARVAAERRRAIEAARGPFMATELAQLELETAQRRKAAEDRFRQESAAAEARHFEERRSLADQWYQVQLQLGNRSLQEELARQQAIVASTAATSRAQITALQAVATLQSQLRAQATAALDAEIQKAEEAARKAAQAAGLSPEATDRAVRNAPLGPSSGVDSLVDLEKARRAQAVRERGGTITAEEGRLLRRLADLEAQERDRQARLFGPSGPRNPFEEEGRGPDIVTQTAGRPSGSDRLRDLGLGQGGEPAFTVAGQQAGQAFADGFAKGLQEREIAPLIVEAVTKGRAATQAARALAQQIEAAVVESLQLGGTMQGF